MPKVNLVILTTNCLLGCLLDPYNSKVSREEGARLPRKERGRARSPSHPSRFGTFEIPSSQNSQSNPSHPTPSSLNCQNEGAVPKSYHQGFHFPALVAEVSPLPQFILLCACPPQGDMTHEAHMYPTMSVCGRLTPSHIAAESQAFRNLMQKFSHAVAENIHALYTLLEKPELGLWWL